MIHGPRVHPDPDETVRVVANLDVESEWAGLRRPGLPRPGLRRAARARIAALGSLLRVFCRPGDRLHLAAPLDPARLPSPRSSEEGELPLPILESPQDGKLPSCGALLPWGVSPTWPRRLAPTWSRRLRRERRVDPAVVARVNDRAHTLEAARELGCALPYSRMVSSIDDLQDILDQADAPSAWIVKAPLCAAGRHRILCRPDLPPPNPDALRGLFRRHGELLFEPWLHRVADYGLLFSVGSAGDDVLEGEPPKDLSFHHQNVDDRGAFLGIAITADAPHRPSFLSPEEQANMVETAIRVAERLAQVGYRGPVGIDFWRHRGIDGKAPPTLHPIGEINARLTFGWVARALAERLAPEAASQGRNVELRFGRGPVPADDASGETIHPLLLPGPDDPTSAWLVTRPEDPSLG